MITYKLSLLLGEGLIFGLLAIGIYISFQWLRFPDLTPDGSFVFGACAYVKAVYLGVPPIIALAISICAGIIAGSFTASINRFARIPSVVAGLLVSSSLYSITWLLLGKPNQFLDPKYTLVGEVTGVQGASLLLVWLLAICLIAFALLNFFSGSIWGLRARAIGENALLAQDIGSSETRYTFLGLALANGMVALAGSLFAQRSFSADINMGIGITITGLAGMLLGLLISRSHRRLVIILSSVIAGSILHKAVIFLTLEAGMPAEAFRLISAIVLVMVFFAVRSTSLDFLRKLKWN